MVRRESSAAREPAGPGCRPDGEVPRAVPSPGEHLHLESKTSLVEHMPGKLLFRTRRRVHLRFAFRIRVSSISFPGRQNAADRTGNQRIRLERSFDFAEPTG